jgi:hypothetical protein
MKAKFIKSGYITEKLNGFIDDKIKVSNLIDHAWAYIESDTVEMLEKSRAILIKALKAKDQKYIS